MKNETKETSPIFNNKEQLVNNLLDPFLNWARTQVIHTPTITKSARAAGIAGFVTGSVGVYAFFPLGGDFANIVSDFLKINDPLWRDALYYFFATDAIIPMIALSGLATKNHFQQLAMPTIEHTLITKQNRKLIRQGLIATAYVLGLFAAITPAYVTTNVLQTKPLWIKVLMSIPAYLGGFMYKIDAEKRLLDRAFNAFSPGETAVIINMRMQLKGRLTPSMKIISEMTDKELDAIFNKVMGKIYPESEEKNIQQQTLDRLKPMFDQSSINTDIQPLPQESKLKLKQWGRHAASGSGFVIGGLSAYTYFALGEQACLVLCDWLGISDPNTRKDISKFIASLVVIPWGSLGAEATQKRFEQIYDSFFNKSHKTVSELSHPTIRKVIYGYSIFGGLSAAIPLTYLAIKATEQMTIGTRVMLVIPAFLGPASVRTNALNIALNQCMNWVDNLKQENTEIRRDKFIKAMTTLTSALDKLPDGCIIELYKNIFVSHSDTLVDITSVHQKEPTLASLNSDEKFPLLDENQSSARTSLTNCCTIM